MIKPQPEDGTYNKLIYKEKELTLNSLRNYAKYQIGDILWVRETTRIGAWDLENGVMAFDYKASPELNNTPWNLMQEPWFEEEVIKIADELSAKALIRIKPGIINGNLVNLLLNGNLPFLCRKLPAEYSLRLQMLGLKGFRIFQKMMR